MGTFRALLRTVASGLCADVGDDGIPRETQKDKTAGHTLLRAAGSGSAPVARLRRQQQRGSTRQHRHSPGHVHHHRHGHVGNDAFDNGDTQSAVKLATALDLGIGLHARRDDMRDYTLVSNELGKIRATRTTPPSSPWATLVGMTFRLLLPTLVAFALAAVPQAMSQAVSVTTYHNDNSRRGLNDKETILDTADIVRDASRVENRRSGFSLPVAVGVLSHGPPQSGLA
jgi:hypothetical protein